MHIDDNVIDNGDDFNDWANTLPTEIEGGTRPSKNEKRFPCPTCGGTGVYQDVRIHQHKSHCFACRGKGYFKTDPRKLQQNRVAAAQRKAAKKAEAIDGFREANPGLFEFLQDCASWSEFAASLFASVQKYHQDYMKFHGAGGRLHERWGP